MMSAKKWLNESGYRVNRTNSAIGEGYAECIMRQVGAALQDSVKRQQVLEAAVAAMEGST
jgi:hypothetical protein